MDGGGVRQYKQRESLFVLVSLGMNKKYIYYIINIFFSSD